MPNKLTKKTPPAQWQRFVLKYERNTSLNQKGVTGWLMLSYDYHFSRSPLPLWLISSSVWRSLLYTRACFTLVGTGWSLSQDQTMAGAGRDLKGCTWGGTTNSWTGLCPDSWRQSSLHPQASLDAQDKQQKAYPGQAALRAVLSPHPSRPRVGRELALIIL